MTVILRLIAGTVLGVATYIISTSSNSKHELSLLYAAVVVAGATAWQVYIAVGTWLTGVEPNRSRDLMAAIANRYVEMYDTQHILRDEVTKVSFHVWEVPLWYRRIFPFAFRKTLKRVFSTQIQQHALTPALRRAACYSIEQIPPGDVVFRKGYGLVGIALGGAVPTQVLGADFEAHNVQQALTDGPTAWEGQPITTTYHLTHEDAIKISNRYGQALATVIKSPRTGERIGCLTVEVRKDYPQRLANLPELPTALDRLSLLIGRIIDK